MKGYFAMTFLCRVDAIMMRDEFYNRKIIAKLIGAISCIPSKCSYVLAIENVQLIDIKKIIHVSKKPFDKLYYVENINKKSYCVRVQ